MTVWVDAWQMQCCGQPFALGTVVSWSLRDPDREWLTAVLGADVAATVDAAEERHDGVDGRRSIDAIVTSIAAISHGYAHRPDAATPTDVDAADGWTPSHDDRELVGYLVGLSVTVASGPVDSAGGRQPH